MAGVEGKVAVVTGAASGFGAATARRLVSGGASVVLADIDIDRAKVLAEDLGDKALAVRVDVREDAQVAEMIATAEREFGGLDILINNAGLAHQVGPTELVSDADFDTVIDINVRGVFLGVRHGVPALRRRGGGVILNTSSVGGILPRANAGVYYPSKGWVQNYTQALAVELGPNIRVNCVCPSLAATDFVVSAQGGNREKAAEAIANGLPVAGIPMGRICDPMDIANAFAFLASDEASYITGVILPVDGGLSAGIHHR